MNVLADAKLLVVDDDKAHRIMLRTLLSSWGATVSEAADGSEAINLCRDGVFDLVLMDVQMPDIDGIKALQAVKSYNPAIPVIIMTAYSNVEAAVEALKSGAYDYLAKPLDFDVLRHTIERSLDHASLKEEVQSLKEKLDTGFSYGGIIGASPEMRKLMEMLAMVAPSEATVLICGESGTGKELIASAIHRNSPRSNGPFIAVNCAALSESLLESLLFGHEKGAFTGADRRREGHFVQADNGTLFLDEIGEISPSVQAKLLRVLQEREFQRVGGSELIRVNVRIVAATNKKLEEEVGRGRFRNDLYYRLNVVSIELPPLAARSEDVPLLAAHFLERYAQRNNKKIKGFTPGAMNLLLKYAWPGNVRELENVIERAVVLLIGDYISERELPPSLLDKTGNLLPKEMDAEFQLAGYSLEELEKQAISDTLSRCAGNKSEAARQLGVTRKTLHAKLLKYNINGS